MKGDNILEISEAVLKAAVQLYIDEVVFKDGCEQEVVSIAQQKDNNFASTITYRVTLKAIAKADE